MTLDEVMKYYKTYQELARDLNITPQAIHYWIKQGHVPFIHQLQLERLSEGVLKADECNKHTKRWKRINNNNNDKE